MENEEIIAKVEEFAANLMTIEDIAILCGIDEDSLRSDISNKKSRYSIAYRRGKATTTFEIHKQEIQLAKLASPAAVENANKFLQEMTLNED